MRVASFSFICLLLVASGRANPIPVPPPASMPLEDIHVQIQPVGDGLHAVFTGEFTFTHIPEDVNSMMFPVPPDGNSIGAWMDGAPLTWAWSSEQYPTILPEMPTIPMIEWQGPFPLLGAVFRVDYEHDLIKRPTEFIFFYACGTGKYFPTYDKTTTAYFDIELPSRYTVNGVWLDETPHEYEVVGGHLMITVESHFGPIVNDLIASLSETLIYVATDGNDVTGDGSKENPFRTIQKGIDTAIDGHTVLVADGTYTGDGNRDIDFKGKAITVRSENGPENCVIDCEGTETERHRGFVFQCGEGPDSMVRGLTITNGYAPLKELFDLSYWEPVGGAILCDGSSPTISNCALTGNKSIGGWFGGYGGGIYCLSGSPRITDCTLEQNTSGMEGGGMECVSSRAIITNCSIVGNDSGYGGGLFCVDDTSIISGCRIGDNTSAGEGGGIHCTADSSPTISDCTIMSNSAGLYGGGLYCHDNGSPDITNCVINGNSAESGGAMYSAWQSSPRLRGCIVTGNSAENDGGGILCLENCNPTATNCTITKNSALVKGGGAFSGTDGNLTLTNCVLWDNSAEFGPQIYLFGGSVAATYSDVQGGYAGEGNIDADPLFVDPNGDDYHIAAGSPCIDAGDPNYPAEPNETDLDGNPRVVNGIVDMGAYEFPGLLYVDDDAPNDPGPSDPDISDPLEDGSEAHPFDMIQEAIDVAQDGHTVLVETGLYTGPDAWICGQTNFLGKNITVTSTDPTDWTIVNDTIITGIVEFGGTEDVNCTLTGFAIRDLAYGAIYGNDTHATISYCNISGNGPCRATVIEDCDGTISNCLITDNTTFAICGVYPVVFGCNGLIKNCTIANNVSGVSDWYGGTITMENCIVYNNEGPQVSAYDGGTLNISYCCVQDGLEGIDCNGTVNWGLGNIDADPCFVRLGYWDDLQLADGDYHLRSEGWRWDVGFTPPRWGYDYVTSRCADAGNPGSILRDEVMTVLPEDPNNVWGINVRMNMGAYGGTAEASMPPPGCALLGDLSNDGVIDYMDLAGQVEDWLKSANEQPGDLSRDAIVNMVDFAALAGDWLQVTDWAEY